jgi:hypothetical protein
MARFNGKNNTNQTKNLMAQRNNYNYGAYARDEDGLDIKPITDFNFAERVYYGRVDPALSPVYPDTQFIKAVPYVRQPESTPFLMDFVADMFATLSEKFFRSCKLSQIPQNDPFFTDLVAYNSYLDPADDYRDYITTVLDTFNNDYLFAEKREKDIKTVEQYVNHLSKFSEQLGSTFPLTFSGFMLSTQSSIFSTGLAVTIADLPADDDEVKDDFFIKNSTFPLFLSFAKETGFSVNKNVPYMLVADLESPVTKRYMARYLVGSTQSAFNTRYKQTYTSDFDKLLENIITSYRVFVNKKNFVKTLKPCDGKTVSETSYKENINNNVISRLVSNDRLFINLYINIRNIEEDKPYNDNELMTMKRDMNQYLERFGRDEVVRLIANKFTSVRKFKDGGTFSKANKRNLKKDLTNKMKGVTIY